MVTIDSGTDGDFSYGRQQGGDGGVGPEPGGETEGCKLETGKQIDS